MCGALLLVQYVVVGQLAAPPNRVARPPSRLPLHWLGPSSAGQYCSGRCGCRARVGCAARGRLRSNPVSCACTWCVCAPTMLFSSLCQHSSAGEHAGRRVLVLCHVLPCSNCRPLLVPSTSPSRARATHTCVRCQPAAWCSSGGVATSSGGGWRSCGQPARG